MTNFTGPAPMPQNHNRRWSCNAAALLLLGLVALAATAFAPRRRVQPTTLRPLTPQELQDVTSAVHKLQPGAKIGSIRRDADGQVRAFLPGDPLGGMTILVTNDGGTWRASIETLYF